MRENVLAYPRKRHGLSTDGLMQKSTTASTSPDSQDVLGCISAFRPYQYRWSPMVLDSEARLQSVGTDETAMAWASHACLRHQSGTSQELVPTAGPCQQPYPRQTFSTVLPLPIGVWACHRRLCRRSFSRDAPCPSNEHR